MTKSSKTYLFLVSLFLSLAQTSGQQVSHQVFLPAASVTTVQGYSVSQTVGETAVVLFDISSFALTQGFQQPRVKDVFVSKPKGTGVNAYPNPVTRELKILFYGDAAASYVIHIYSFSGTLVYSDKCGFSDQHFIEEIVDMSNFSKGIYLVRVIGDDGRIDRVFKIEKM